jgi:glutamate-5-semialdehyde dehydrogenase
LGTARAIMDAIVAPALAEAGVHPGAIGLVDDPTHAGGWALFDDSRLGLAVARGSGPAVAQLGAVARQAGTPVSLHGTGGAWLVVTESADADWVHSVVASSLDRKVCNTLNVCCVVASKAFEMIPRILDGVRQAARADGPPPRIHILGAALDLDAGEVENLEIVAHPESDIDLLAHEWEWDVTPEMTLVVVDDLDAAIAAYNTYSPRFVASLASQDPDDHERFWAEIDAPFVGNGFTRWVDGQYALGRPELGLSNWEHGRLLARGGVLSGDSVYTVRLRAHQDDPMLHR